MSRRSGHHLHLILLKIEFQCASSLFYVWLVCLRNAPVSSKFHICKRNLPSRYHLYKCNTRCSSQVPSYLQWTYTIKIFLQVFISKIYYVIFILKIIEHHLFDVMGLFLLNAKRAFCSICNRQRRDLLLMYHQSVPQVPIYQTSPHDALIFVHCLDDLVF